MLMQVLHKNKTRALSTVLYCFRKDNCDTVSETADKIMHRLERPHVWIRTEVIWPKCKLSIMKGF